MSTIYCLPGLGADCRMFARLIVPGHELKCVQWIKPECGESLSHYAERLSARISRKEQPVFLGVSLGGVMALELSHFVRPSLIILVSSVSSPAELPWYYRAAGRMRLHRVLPLRVSRFARLAVSHLNGARENSDVQLLQAMLSDADMEFVRWAIDRLVRWKGCAPPGRVVHIHGTSDRLLPIRYVSADYQVPRGTHVMVVSQADEIGRIVAELLGNSGIS